jgi:hypothetical protein
MAATARPLFRPVRLATYRSEEEAAEDQPGSAENNNGAVEVGGTIRADFPVAGANPAGGYSDGYCFRTLFRAGRLSQTYALLRSFLLEQGYGDVPVPATVEELRAFRLPPKLRHQLSLFGEDGYVHNPIKILFPPPGGRRGELVLELYNEGAEGHLLRFHRREGRKR